ncbi:MAG: PspA/IM30 family protein [Calothrix sp. MO_167.B12]|nr:PspA/IM30 family protein [Calothrix sp. MO_167.B12]
MGQLFRRTSRVIKANLNSLATAQKDPEDLLESMIIEIQEDVLKVRLWLDKAISAQKNIEKQYNEAKNEINKWQRNAQLALQKGDENTARQALELKKILSKKSKALKTSLDEQTIQADVLKRKLIQLESQLSEVKTKKEMLKARITAAKAQEQLGSMVKGMNSSSAMAAFDRMEEKLMMQEARAQSVAELAASDLESQFAQLESSDVDNELAALKAQMSLPGCAINQNQLLQQDTNSQPDFQPQEPVDAELDALRKQLEQM